MRLIALYAMLATSLSLCERRNPEICVEGDAELACQDGKVCRAGRCEAPECSNVVPCTDVTRPICKASQCAPCQADNECAQRSAGTPYCRMGRCAACNGSADCPDPLQPICDPQAFQCRPCQKHGECAPGVCAKDDLLSGLPGALSIKAGACVPAERVLTVDGNNCRPPAPCNPKDALDQASPMQPYVRLASGQGAMFTNLGVPGPMNTSGLTVFHLIGPMADTPPTKIDTLPVTLGLVPGGTAISVAPGARAVIEGVPIKGGLSGVKCSGTAVAGETEVRLERVVIGSTYMAVEANSCRVTLRESWIGAGFGAIFGDMIGNRQAMSLQNSELTIENSVLFRNGIFSFGGISLLYDLGWKGAPSSIVNSTIAFQSVSAPSGAVSLDCNTSVSDRLVIFNTFFYNDLLMWQGQATRHIAAVCQPQLEAVATNDDRLARDAAAGVLVATDADTGFQRAKDPIDLRLRPGAPRPVAAGGTARFVRDRVDLPAPPRDLEGAPRGQQQAGRVSIGAFEAPSP